VHEGKSTKVKPTCNVVVLNGLAGMTMMLNSVRVFGNSLSKM